jgi:3-oxoacyl-[acyl-carrier protein] reductase
MTKAAIENFTKTCAQELAHYKILVNAVAPGFIETQMTEAIPQEQKQELLKRVPLGEMGRPEDVATMVRFLATEGNYCTGNVFHVNGGMYGG